ncbi:sugar nucleotide-binding protein [Teredinibacter sp. KSP-S5-2]|uniref:sugar nucleotide-binding protein n=1 Tax=Teredinibacter sp. KSP-S5-2 TaxID=3034506 RepID=UPI002934FA16|nr:sugar nucleotide-binding protein [Teredinibacter sp. KSP-S5-2]WNO09744.1 sugar nucleotide-binding protein [Teredinibacter sp. KSP-S5-2]
MAFKLLVLGAKSCLRVSLLNTLEEMPYSVQLPELEGMSPEELASQIVAARPSITLLLVDPNNEQGYQAAETALKGLQLAYEQRSTPLIALSSHRVFGDQFNESGLREEEEPNPTPDDKDASLWLDYEREVAKIKDHILLRSSWFIDGDSTSLVDRFAPKLLHGKTPFKASSKHELSPVTIKTTTNALIAIMQQVLCGAENWGVFHLSSSDSCSEYEFVNKLADTLREYERESCEISECSVDDFTHRIAGTGNLRGKRLTKNFGIQQVSWRSGFSLVVKHYLESLPDEG